ncbi:NifU family protein [Cryomorpha ignava]|uniref:NifU family protein n=1 Tax=Cryomorpha ignava TaxID=101383 RepID=A0A7K3WMT5_9FLAO|nr:NifU family protein [Cryomorpha ignava]NEN22959.1 NifU family protein [Cryomorpha ignava]
MENLVERIQHALLQIRPFLEADRGDITLVEVTDDMVARVKLHGACKDCSMIAMTMKAGVEESIKKVAPEIVSVEAINLVRVK